MLTSIAAILAEIAAAEKAAAADIKDLHAEIAVRRARAATQIRLWTAALAGPTVREAWGPPPARAPRRFLWWARRQGGGPRTLEAYQGLWRKWAAAIVHRWRREAAASPRVQAALTALAEDTAFGRRQPLSQTIEYVDRLREAHQSLVAIRGVLRRAATLGIRSVEIDIDPAAPLVTRAAVAISAVRQHPTWIAHEQQIEDQMKMEK